MMTRATLEQLEQQGVVFQLENDRVKINAPAHLMTPELRAELSRHKSLLCEWLKPILMAGSWRDRYEERCRILEHEGGCLLHEAKQYAQREVFYQYAEHYYPLVVNAYLGAIEGKIH